MLGLLQIDQKGTCGRNAEREATHGETLETLDLELVAKTLHGRLIGEGPLVHGRDIVLVSEPFLCSLLITPLHEQLLRGEGGEEGGYIVQISLSQLEGARGYIQEGRATSGLLVAQAHDEIVFLLPEQLLVEGHSRGNQLGDSPLHQALCQFRILQLVADGDLVARPHELGKICLKGMVGNAGHRNGA